MTKRATVASTLRDERGSVIVLVAACLLVFLIGAAFVVDIGNARQVARNYQNAADGAALAGAQGLPDSALLTPTPVDYAADYAFQTLLGVGRPAPSDCNDAQLFPAGERPLPAAGAGTPQCYTSAGLRVYVTTPWTDTPADPTPLFGGYEVRQINVKVCGTVIAGFARVVGIDFVQPCRRATAMSALGTGPCALCVLNGSFDMSGGSATVSGSSAWINGNATNSGGVFSAPDGFYVGGTSTGFTPPATEGAPSIVDPLAWLPGAMQRQPNWAPPYLPDRLSFTFDPTGGLNQSIDPGVWNNIRVNAGTSNHTLTLNPGFYVVRGKFEILGDVNVVGNGVTIYFACDFYWQNPCAGDPGPAAYFDHRGAGNVALSAITTPGDPYQNLLFFFDRDANQTELNRFSGGSANITGTIYAPSAQFEIGGGVFNSLLVARSMTFSGNTPLTVNYDPTQQVPTFLPALIS
jgi:hypothetical protein